jgi:hypothetical protein
MQKEYMLEYEFIDKYVKSLATNVSIDTSEMIFLLEVKKQEYAYIILSLIGLLGIIFLAVITYWM